VIRENNLAYIESIIVKGMVKTQENVIRRELLMKEGQLYNSALVNRSRERLINLGYFKEVNLQMRPGSDDQNMNLIIDVVEQPTGTISMGGGYGTASGFSIFVEGGETNLNGTGQRITGKLNYGPTTQMLGATWTDPWFYESCSDSTGSFWKNKQKQFDEARDFESILSIASALQNTYESYNDAIVKYIQAENTVGPAKIESIDRVKSKIRSLLYNHVEDEESCYRRMPRPWALSLSTNYTARIYESSASSTLKIADSSNNLFETSRYDVSSVGVGVGISHSFLLNWAHYHRYNPSWSEASNPSALVSDQILKRVKLGWQHKSSFTNGLIYDNRDNVFSPTSGINLDLSIETVGQMLGGQDHYNQYSVAIKYYHWWFDYTFGGLIRRNALRKWRVVQEFRTSGIFTHEAAPHNKNQDKEINPYIEANDRLYLGGYESLRGYDWQDAQYPDLWQDGANHMLLAGTEIRFPIEPSILWMVLFMDSGALYENLGEKTGDEKEAIENYRSELTETLSELDPSMQYIFNKYNFMKGHAYFHENLTDWRDPYRTVFSRRNIALDRMMYSWGFGVRIQIPVLPLRLYMAQKVYYAGNMSFKPIPGDDEWEFVFGIGDFRF
jgi:outer membrane protein assembly complex protein YaeT